MFAKQWLMAGAMTGFFSVVLGAFGAHGLKDKLSPYSMQIYQTAVHYQMFHAVALLVLGLYGILQPQAQYQQYAGWGFLIGIILFSGSLFALAITDIKPLGMITPFGGVAFLVGWASLSFSFFKGQY